MYVIRIIIGPDTDFKKLVTFIFVAAVNVTVIANSSSIHPTPAAASLLVPVLVVNLQIYICTHARKVIFPNHQSFFF